MKNLKGRVVVITGASSGIGEATAKNLASQGAIVVLGARRMEKLKTLKSNIEIAGGTALIVQTDVTRQNEVKTLVQLAVKEFGRVDVMMNNAGIMPLSDMTNLRVNEWEQTIDINIKGVLYGIAAALPYFQKQKSGHFINISSVGGRRVYPGCAVYCATKFAVRALSESLRRELALSENIKVTVVEPGAVKTELPESINDPIHKERLQNWRKEIDFLEADDVAESISYALAQADHVNVDEILLTPRQQAH